MSSDSECENNIPMADEDPSSVIQDVTTPTSALSSAPSSAVEGTLNPQSFLDEAEQQQMSEEQEEKARLIAQVLELQNTLDDLSSRVDNVKEENLRLRSENQVLGQYIENLMAASSVFQPANEPTNKTPINKKK